MRALLLITCLALMGCKSRMRPLLLAAAIVLLPSCGMPQQPMESMQAAALRMRIEALMYNPNSLREDSLLEMCAHSTVGTETQKRALAEIRKRGLLNARELQLAAEKKVATGQRPNALIASWGRPETINSSGGLYGHHEQWVYGLGQYVYFDNGLVVMWQQSE
jgi:hypothetical protein